MKNDLTCGVVGDLLPSYVENLLGEESRQAVDRHVADCPSCAARLRAMTAPAAEPPEETVKEVDYLKRIKRRNRFRVLLAALLAAAAIVSGFAVKVFLIGTPIQPQSYALRTYVDEENALHLVIDCVESAAAFFGWDVDDAEGIVTVSGRRVLVSAFHRDGWGRLEIPLEGVEEVYLCGELVYQNGMQIDRGTLELYNAKTPYVGDAPALGKIVDALNLQEDDVGGFSTELTTSQRPYRWTINFQSVPHRYAMCYRMSYMDAPLMLALVENLDEVGWTFTDTKGVNHNHVLTLEEVNARLQELAALYNEKNGTDWPVRESVKDYAASPAELVRLGKLLSMRPFPTPLPCEE